MDKGFHSEKDEGRIERRGLWGSIVWKAQLRERGMDISIGRNH